MIANRKASCSPLRNGPEIRWGKNDRPVSSDCWAAPSDWSACAPALGRLGAVIVAGCRDAVAARQLGFVPTQGIGTALEMAHGRAGGPPRVGFLLSPPYFPLRVTTERAQV